MLTCNVILVGLIIVQRLFELRLSRRHQRRWTRAGVATVRDSVFPWMVLTHVLLLLGSVMEPWLLGRPFIPMLGWPALSVLVAAQVLRVHVIKTLGRHWNVRIVASCTDETERVVTTGPYRFVRHPNYAIVLVEAVALPLFHGAFVTLVVVQLLHIPVLVARIRAEERYLMSLPSYREAMADKPRFVPRLWSRRRPDSTNSGDSTNAAKAAR
jgi:methyltransferase